MSNGEATAPMTPRGLPHPCGAHSRWMGMGEAPLREDRGGSIWPVKNLLSDAARVPAVNPTVRRIPPGKKHKTIRTLCCPQGKTQIH